MTFFSAFYIILHAFYAVLELIFETGFDFCHEFWGQEHVKNQLHYQGNKSLKHLTLLLGNEEPSYEDLANIVNWCLIHEIAYLSLYDQAGKLKRNFQKLHKALARRLLGDRVIWHPTTNAAKKINGFFGKKIHLKVLSQEDGKSQIVQLTKNLTSIQQDLSIGSIDEELRKSYEFPDPDLALCCGKFLGFNGYPPWQIRLTEFLTIKTHFGFKYKTFLDKLAIYGKCEQRVGK